ncbi:MAG TPA: ABC transporter substrate-binding protein [Chloroflexota bacterium]|nr:ABC transporter substrate-binding protein [Chloroflexota bacterium]
MDPIVGNASAWALAMLDPLINHDADGKYIPMVADSWDVSPDSLTWTFHIHKGIKFHNGDPLTSADVLFSLKHFGDKKSTNPWSPYVIADSTEITTPDDYTLVYKLKAPELSIREPFAQTLIMPKKYFEKVGEDGWQKAPVGSGPYKFVEHVPKTRMTFAANTDYWQPYKPQWQQVIETLVPDESTRIAQLERGDVDIIGALSADNLLALKGKGYTLQQVGLPGLENISFQGTWMTKGPTSDIRVRQAMSYAINRDELSKTFYRGLAKPGGFWFWSQDTWAHDVDPSSWQLPAAEQLKYDVAKAKQLLQQAGFPGKFTPQDITLYTPAGPSADLMQILQGYWQKVGIKVNVQVLDTAVYLGRLFARAKKPTDVQVGQIFPWGPGGPFPSFFNNVYHSANMFTSVGVHTTGNDPQADKMYQAALHEPDETKAKKLWNDLMHYGYDKMWINVPIVDMPSDVVLGPHVGQFTRFANTFLQQAYVGITHGK